MNPFDAMLATDPTQQRKNIPSHHITQIPPAIMPGTPHVRTSIEAIAIGPDTPAYVPLYDR